MISLLSSFQSLEFSATLPDVRFKVSRTRARVTVTASKGSTAYEAFSEALYPGEDGSITLSDLDALVEPFVRKYVLFGLSVLIAEEYATGSGNDEAVEVTDTRTLSTQVVCCRANVLNTSANAFCQFHFLTLMEGTRRTAMGWREFLCFIGSGTATCTARYDDGATVTLGVPVLTSSGDFTMLETSPQGFASSGRRLLGYEIAAGSRRQAYEVDYGLDSDIAPALLFVNSFGVQETAYCTGEHRQASSFDRRQARIGRLKETYGLEEKEIFKADTGILSFPMANWWREVLRSRDVRLLRVYDGVVTLEQSVPVVITSEKAELSNAPDHLPRLTFEYEYADRNHNVFDMRAEGRIFDDTFDYTFN